MPPQATERIAKGARAVSIAVLASRLLGLVREQVLAGLFGAGFQMDAYVVAYRIPNLLRDLFAEGAFASSFVTVFSHTREREGEEATWALASRALSCLLVIVLGITLLGEVLAPTLVSLLAPGFSVTPAKAQLATLLTRIMFPFLVTISLSALFGGILNTFGYFFLPAISSAFFNLVSVALGVGLYFVFKKQGTPEILGMAVGVVIGGLAQAFIQFPSLKRLGFRFVFAPRFSDPKVREIFRLMAPMVLGLSAVQLNIFLNTYFASLCGEGAVSWLSYAFRIMYVPLGLFGVALSVAILPVTSAQVAQGDLKALRSTYVSCFLMGLALALPSALGLIILARPIVRLLFEHGQFSPLDTLNTSLALKFFSISLPAYAITKITAPVFYALRRPKVPMLSSFFSVLINGLTVLALIKPLGFKAVALGMALGITAQAFLQVGILYHVLQGFDSKRLMGGGVRIIFCAALMGFTAWKGQTLLNTLSGWLFSFGLLGLIAFCAAFYFASAKLLAPKEALYLLDSLLTKRRAPSK